MITRGFVVVLLATVACVAFGLGRASAAGALREEHDDDDDDDDAAHRPLLLAPRKAPRLVTTPSSRWSAALDTNTTPPPAPAAPACRETAAFAQSCATRLNERETELTAVEALRVEREGTPIAPRPLAPERFASTTLATAVQDAFSQAHVPGGADGVDCSEFPCIVFGRINGTEDEMEKLEKAPSLTQYRNDILTVLLWTVSDVPANAAAKEQGDEETNHEQSLFAVAFYPASEQMASGENLDRRIRTRTSELWNTMAPSDETAAAPH